MTEGEPRFRINAKQTAKNLWQFDATCENHEDTITVPLSEDDVANVEKVKLGVKLLSIIKEAEKAFREDNKKLVSDIE